jgi:hypothetical protein
MSLRLALVPTEAVEEDGVLVRRPRLPAAIYGAPQGWGQASSDFEPESQVLVWLRCDDATADSIQRRTGSRVLSICASAADADRMVAAMRAGDSGAAREEFLAAYRTPAKVEEEALRKQRGRARLEAVIAWVVATLGIAAAAAMFPGVGLLGAVLHADTFNRADAALNGSTMSDGLGAWTADAGLNVVSNALVISTVDHRGHDSAMAATGNMTVTATNAAGRGGGPIARYAAGPDGYLMFRRQVAGNPVRLSRLDDGVQTVLGTGSNSADGTILGARAVSSAVVGLRNGSIDIGPVTDSTYATGVAGVGRVGTENCTLDDWQVETDASGALLRALTDGGLSFSAGAL